MHMVLDAPKVAIPAADAKGRATLALDFGRFIVESGGWRWRGVGPGPGRVWMVGGREEDEGTGVGG